MENNKRPSRAFFIIAAAVMIPATIVLVLALTDVLTDNPFKEYRIVVVMGYIALGGFVREAYKRQVK